MHQAYVRLLLVCILGTFCNFVSVHFRHILKEIQSSISRINYNNHRAVTCLTKIYAQEVHSHTWSTTFSRNFVKKIKEWYSFVFMCPKLPDFTFTGISPVTEVLSHSMCIIGQGSGGVNQPVLVLHTIPDQFFSTSGILFPNDFFFHLFLDYIPRKE